MNKYTGTLSAHSKKALAVFLARTTVKGSEVPIFNNLLKELHAFTLVAQKEPDTKS